jgi:hypothetical protein
MAADIGTGSTILFESSGFDAFIRGIEWQGVTREIIEQTNLGELNARACLPSDLHNPGTVALEISFEPNERPPITEDEETIRVRHPDGAGYSVSVIVTAWEWLAPLESLMTARVELKASGPITFATRLTIKNDAAVVVTNDSGSICYVETAA